MEKLKEITTIDQVIDQLEDIIIESETANSTLGYFAALYKKVTIKVKEEIANNSFDDGLRMEKLDIVFAKRYIDAYTNWKEKNKTTKSWQYAFDMGNNKRLIVLQHLLLGMNAHINLDLGIAASEISTKDNIDKLENDFKRINEILSSLVNEVQEELSQIWPLLRRILNWTKKADNIFIDFSMELARDGAWKFAKMLALGSKDDFGLLIEERDKKVADKALIITYPGTVASLVLRIVGWGEKGTILERIKLLR
jgi:hypothetical protein